MKASADPIADLAEETRRRVAWRLMPFIFILYIVSYLDRVNVGFAAALLQRARGAVSRKRREPDRQWTLTMIDIDRFKDVNDNHGHPTGDQVLVRLAGLLRARLRQADLVGRYGGEEFAVVLEDLSAPEAARLVERLRADFASIEHRPRDGEAFRVTISAGLAALEEAEDLSSWVQAADAALYSAKNGGRDRVVVAPPRGPSPGTA